MNNVTSAPVLKKEKKETDLPKRTFVFANRMVASSAQFQFATR